MVTSLPQLTLLFLASQGPAENGLNSNSQQSVPTLHQTVCPFVEVGALQINQDEVLLDPGRTEKEGHTETHRAEAV